MNKAERTYRRKLEERDMHAAAAKANARFARVFAAFHELLGEEGGRAALRQAGIDAVCLGRSMRFGDNGRPEGLCILEGIVLGGTVSRYLDDTRFVRYLSAHHPAVLSQLHWSAELDR